MAPPSLLPENCASGYRIYASFCSREIDATNPSTLNWLEYYDPGQNSWNYVSSVPTLFNEGNHALKDFAMASIGDKIYIIGGRLCRRDPEEEFGRDVEVISSVLCYNVRTGEWSKCSSLNIPRYEFACTVSDNKIYACGGQSTLACGRGVSSTEVYDPSFDTWTPLPNMNRLRYKCVGVTWQGKVHVVGGFCQSNYIDRCSAEVYNVQSGKWDLVSGLWQLDVPPNQIVALEETLYSSGDCLNAWKGHIESFDGKLGIWNIVERSQRKIFPSPLSSCTTYSEDSHMLERLYLTMAPIKGNLFFLAGYKMPGASRTISMVHSFDTSATSVDGSAWSSFEPMVEEGEREICGHCCVVQM